MPNSGADIFSYTIVTYPYSDGAAPRQASTLIHGNDDKMLINSLEYAHLCFLVRCIARIVGGTIFCKSGNNAAFRGCHKLLTYLLIKKIEVNIPLLIFRSIWHENKSGRSSYPHGILISSVLTHHRLNLTTFPSVSTLVPFSQVNLTQMNYRDWACAITLETPLLVPPKSIENKKRFRVEILDSDEESDDEEEEATTTTAEPIPTVSAPVTSPLVQTLPFLLPIHPRKHVHLKLAK